MNSNKSTMYSTSSNSNMIARCAISSSTSLMLLVPKVTTTRTTRTTPSEEEEEKETMIPCNQDHNDVDSNNMNRVGMLSTLLSSSQGLSFVLIIAMYLLGQKGTITTTTTLNNDVSPIHLTKLHYLLNPANHEIHASPFLASSLVFIYAIALRMLLFGQPLKKIYFLALGGNDDNYEERQSLLSSSQQEVVTTSNEHDERLSTYRSSMSFSAIRSSLESSCSSSRLLDISGGAIQHNKKTNNVKLPTTCVMAIANKDSFYPIDDISNLTLNDINDALRFVVDMNRSGFNKRSFLSTLRKSARNAIHAIEDVVVESKGSNVRLSLCSPHQEHRRQHHHHVSHYLATASAAGDVDALAFAAFVRIFAEWRMHRLVPTRGYQRYGMGMGLAKRDLIQNVEKIEVAVHEYINFYRREEEEKEGCKVISSPTIRQLLQYEINQKKHPNLPKLCDKSAATGLLWIHRQLQYQTSVFSNLLKIQTGGYQSAKYAVLAAYKSTYEQYHGFVVRQLFQRSFDAAPDADVILQHMNLPYAYYEDDEHIRLMGRHDDTVEANPQDSSVHDPEDYHELDHSWKARTDGIEDHIQHQSQNNNMNPLEQFGSHIANELMKLQRFFNQCNGICMQPHPSNNAFLLERKESSKLLLQQQLESNSTHAVKDSTTTTTTRTLGEDDIPAFIATSQPFLNGLDNLISEFNMRDPTKC